MSHDHKKDGAATDHGKQKTWKEIRTQPRVRPQWDAVKLAHKLLDRMEEREKQNKR